MRIGIMGEISFGLASSVLQSISGRYIKVVEDERRYARRVSRKWVHRCVRCPDSCDGSDRV